MWKAEPTDGVPKILPQPSEAKETIHEHWLRAWGRKVEKVGEERTIFIRPARPNLGTRPVGGTSHLLRAEVTRHPQVRWREGLYAGQSDKEEPWDGLLAR